MQTPRTTVTLGSPPEANPGTPVAWRGARSQICIILTIGTCVIALLWLIMFNVIQNERRAAVEHAGLEANNLSAAFRSELTRTMFSVARAMDAVAARMQAAPDRFDINEWAREIPLLAAAAVHGAILGSDGKLLSSTLDDHPTPVDFSDREHFRVHLDGKFKGLFVSKPLNGRLTGKTVLQVSRRVEAADGGLLGVIVFSLAPDQLTSLHKSIDLGPRGRLIVIGTADGVVRACFGTGKEAGYLGSGGVLPADPEIVGDTAPDRSFIRRGTVDHVTRLYSIRSLSGFPLRVAVGFDLSDVLAAPAAHARLLETDGIIATLMLVILMALLTIEIRRRNDQELRLRDEQGRLAAEIRQGAQAQARLRASEARLRDFAEMASDWFWEQDAELRFTATTLEGPEHSGADRTYFGKHPWEVYDIGQAPELWAAHKRDLLARRPFRDFRHSRPDANGTLRHVSINGVPVFDESGTFLGYRGTGRDITAEVDAAETLRASKEQAEASSKAKSAFLANMSHELRTPLNAIIGFSELIQARKTGAISNEYVEWAGDILASGRHLLELINDVLELSRIEAGRYELDDDTIDLGGLVRGCLTMVRGLAEKNGVRINCAIADRAAVLRADRRAVKQVVLNLLTNAVKFTPSGGVVAIRVEADTGGAIAFLVSDTGIGIDPAALPKLCKPFMQADVSTSRRYGGTGLGLAISSRLVALHGGVLSISSVLGQGTTVRVSFPATRVLAARWPVAAAD